MSVTPFPKPAPGQRPSIRPQVGRLASLKKPVTTPIRRPQQAFVPPPPVQTTTYPKPTTCPNPGCPAPHIVEDDGQRVCTGCGTVISEANIVSEVTFGETLAGAAVVQGTFVGADQSHGRGSGPGFQRAGMESREITEQNGARFIAQLSQTLKIPESAQKAAGQVFKLAVGLNFIQGRRTKTVAAICLYIACRRQDGNTTMLIDFADILTINVFKLGRTYKALLDELRLGGNVFIMNPIDPESLIYRFAKQLEFGASTMQVAGEAVRIVQRMNRDWMLTGRRPAGICGAALILAARMNNFRRTVREVVYVVKVTELTIQQRLNEFSITESAHLTIDQFRSVQLENSSDPPAFTRARETEKALRQASRVAAGTSTETGGTRSARGGRIDADGFAIPDPPLDPALMKEAIESGGEDKGLHVRKRGRPKGSRNPQFTFSEAELEAESALENEMSTLLAEGSMSANQPFTIVPGKSAQSIPDSIEIDEAEFESDPEVRYCLLTPTEVEIKERIWVHDNRDYLRAQQAKALKRALLEEEAAANGGLKPKPRKRRKARRMGDVGYLNDEGEGGAGTRASTPAEATRRMLEKRGFSKKINYRLFEGLYEDDDHKEDILSTARTSRAGSVVSESAPSDRKLSRVSASPAPFVTIGSIANPAPSAHTASPALNVRAPAANATWEAGAEPSREPSQGANGEEEILGGVPDAVQPVDPDIDDFEEDEDYDEYIDDDNIEAALAGHYVDQGESDYDYD
ncbi:transcription factor TFIIIB subunit brf1 [Ascosphaera aggregata]|nr:transcription factor TFIIIB subunit brf1 [Ascosphaera aggregata]